MSINAEQFVTANKAAVESLLSVANTALASAERIANLNFDTARSVLEETSASTKALLGAKDVQEAIAIQASISKPNVDKVVAYSKSVYEISAQTQEQLTQMIEAQFGDFQKNVSSKLEKAAKAAPASSDVAVAAVQSAIAAANSAFENMRKTAQQVTEMAQSNIVATTNATTKAAKKATSK